MPAVPGAVSPRRLRDRWTSSMVKGSSAILSTASLLQYGSTARGEGFLCPVGVIRHLTRLGTVYERGRRRSASALLSGCDGGRGARERDTARSLLHISPSVE